MRPLFSEREEAVRGAASSLGQSVRDFSTSASIDGFSITLFHGGGSTSGFGGNWEAARYDLVSQVRQRFGVTIPARTFGATIGELAGMSRRNR